MKNISAHTETTGIYSPGYISINEDGDNVSITVRSSGAQSVSVVRLTRQELSELCKPCLIDEPVEVAPVAKSKRGE